MSEGIVRAVFFCVFSVFSIKKKKFDAKQKCAEKTRRERGANYHAEKPRKKCVTCKYSFIT